jgi:hypothetical protein
METTSPRPFWNKPPAVECAAVAPHPGRHFTSSAGSPAQIEKVLPYAWPRLRTIALLRAHAPRLGQTAHSGSNGVTLRYLPSCHRIWGRAAGLGLAVVLGFVSAPFASAAVSSASTASGYSASFIPTSYDVWATAVDPATDTVYLGSAGSPALVVVNGATGTVTTTIALARRRCFDPVHRGWQACAFTGCAGRAPE